ncbi:hypothetical protein Pla86_13980 [Planctomycetes bacterium Pla86]|uniref:Uncharacterized protein n=1 Tax=Engelhardtia mirabilis TaxID=2528011 RepID=A0A518BH68_9BACT|nr:hypothetical protein Pla133_13990 [Planctomycetes bacterium Pla133]QDV00655.1 hypothetical protein Pla86_13980 [Planctomycetes bacterium Pla86]
MTKADAKADAKELAKVIAGAVAIALVQYYGAKRLPPRR